VAYAVPPALALIGLDLRHTQARLEQVEDWHHMGDAGELGFSTGWSNSSGTVGQPDAAAYLKTNSGLVVVKGRVQKTVSGAQFDLDPIFLLRSGYGTKGNRRFYVNATTGGSPNGAPRRVQVSGYTVYYELGSAIDALVNVDIDISFIAEA